MLQWNLAWCELFTRVFTVAPLFSWYTAYLPAFVIVGEVAVTRETSCTKLLPGVWVLIGLMKMSRTKRMLKLLLSQWQHWNIQFNSITLIATMLSSLQCTRKLCRLAQNVCCLSSQKQCKAEKCIHVEETFYLFIVFKRETEDQSSLAIVLLCWPEWSGDPQCSLPPRGQ